MPHHQKEWILVRVTISGLMVKLSLNILDLAVLLVLGIVVFSLKLSHVIEDGNVNKREERRS